MDSLQPSGTTEVFTSRLKAVAVGFGVTVAPLGMIAVTQFAFMPQIVGTFEGLDRNAQALAVSSLRRDWLTFHAVAAILVASYWLLSTALGRGELLRLRAANISLASFVFAYVVITLYSCFSPWGEVFTRLCPYLGISDTNSPFGFDTLSSCGAFAYAAHRIIVLGTLGLPLLLATSLIVRIVSSRRMRSTAG